MTYLLLQTFLLLLASYFAGAFVACLIKRTFNAPRAAYAAPEPVQVPVQVQPLPAPIPARTPAPPPKFKSRDYELVQPKIDILPRPEPRPAQFRQESGNSPVRAKRKSTAPPRR